MILCLPCPQNCTGQVTSSTQTAPARRQAPRLISSTSGRPSQQVRRAMFVRCAMILRCGCCAYCAPCGVAAGPAGKACPACTMPTLWRPARLDPWSQRAPWEGRGLGAARSCRAAGRGASFGLRLREGAGGQIELVCRPEELCTGCSPACTPTQPNPTLPALPNPTLPNPAQPNPLKLAFLTHQHQGLFHAILYMSHCTNMIRNTAPGVAAHYPHTKLE